MTRPYSGDLRERVVASVSAGRSCRATAGLFGVSVATVVRWSRRHRITGSSAALPMGGRRRLVLLTGRAVRAKLREGGIKVSYGAVWSFLAAEGLTFKKNPARRRAGAPRRRPQARRLEAVSGPG